MHLQTCRQLVFALSRALALSIRTSNELQEGCKWLRVGLMGILVPLQYPQEFCNATS